MQHLSIWSCSPNLCIFHNINLSLLLLSHVYSSAHWISHSFLIVTSLDSIFCFCFKGWSCLARSPCAVQSCRYFSSKCLVHLRALDWSSVGLAVIQALVCFILVWCFGALTIFIELEMTWNTMLPSISVPIPYFRLVYFWSQLRGHLFFIPFA